MREGLWIERFKFSGVIVSQAWVNPGEGLGLYPVNADYECGRHEPRYPVPALRYSVAYDPINRCTDIWELCDDPNCEVMHADHVVSSFHLPPEDEIDAMLRYLSSC